MAHDDPVEGAASVAGGPGQPDHIFDWLLAPAMHLWNPGTQTPIGQPMAHDGAVNGAAFVASAAVQPDRILSWSGEDKTVHLWDARTQRELMPSVMVDHAIRNAGLIRLRNSWNLLVVTDRIRVYRWIGLTF
jgi:WD40 repeat protein